MREPLNTSLTAPVDVAVESGFYVHRAISDNDVMTLRWI